ATGPVPAAWCGAWVPCALSGCSLQRPWVAEIADQAALLQVKVKPRAKQASLEQMPDGSWVARLKSPPVDGKANAELIALIAKHFKCRISAVEIKSGARGRLKQVRVKATNQ